MTAFVRFILAIAIVLGLGAGQVRAFSDDDDASLSGKRDSEYAKAVTLVKAREYQKAIPFLQKALTTDPTNASAYNYLGYSHRKLGDKENALTNYLKALDLDPEHLGANEYLGELYLELGQLDKARERLAVLDDACFFGCEEYRELKAKIKDYEAKAGS